MTSTKDRGISRFQLQIQSLKNWKVCWYLSDLGNHAYKFIYDVVLVQEYWKLLLLCYCSSDELVIVNCEKTAVF